MRPLSLTILLALLLPGCGDKLEAYVCDPVCPSGFHCQASGCVADSAMAVPDLAAMAAPDLAGCNPPCGGNEPFCLGGVCVPCMADSNCPAGQVCQASGVVRLCVPGCTDDSRCAGLDGGAATLRCCGGACVDTTTDTANCGDCGTTCAADHATPSCIAGACTAATCQIGFSDCNHDPSDGCEVNLGLDPANCTACGNACQADHASLGCSSGCYLRACTFGWGDCNLDIADGCEMDMLSDTQNCGECGASCPSVPHAKVGCQLAACRLVSCTNGFLDCDGGFANGCEVPAGNDKNNCGACGNVCAAMQVCVNGNCTCKQCNIRNAKTKCINGVQCLFDKCLPDWGDCNNDLTDGCEHDLTTDENNCGACGNVCPNNLPHCEASVCSLAPVLVGKFQVDAGPIWNNGPPCYTCLQACALIFGGDAVDYSCSTQMGMIDHQAQSSIYGVGGCHVIAEDFKVGDTYNVFNQQSAYVRDNCIGQIGLNYCFK